MSVFFQQKAAWASEKHVFGCYSVIDVSQFFRLFFSQVRLAPTATVEFLAAVLC